MNHERIKLIAEQAEKECIDVAQNFAWEWEKKFAELIVHECVTMLDHNGNYLIDDAATKQIKEHFGIGA